MLFNSWQFLIFMTVVFLLYWFIKAKYRPYILVVSNFVFYASWGIRYFFFLTATIVYTFFAGFYIEKCENKKQKKIILIVSILLCVGMLLFFKYYSFLFKTLSNISPVSIKAPGNIVAPIGISFYMFQSLGYLIDVYKCEYTAEKNILDYALFVSFFPVVISGPICRAKNLLPQLKKEVIFEYNNVSYGMKQIGIGLFKKMVVANTLGITVDKVFNNLYLYKGFALVLIGVFYMIQIYCDFSGYSDIAIGCAKILGINIPENFNLPYFSNSIKDFWRRWHISLSTWFRDYVYIPLGGNKKGTLVKYRNLLLTFLLSGLWHGANFTYILWGGVHGLLQIIEDYLSKIRIRYINIKNKTKLLGCLKYILVIFILLLTWIIFRADSVQDAAYFIGNMFNGIDGGISYFANGFKALNIDKVMLLTISCSIAILGIIDILNYVFGDVIEKISKMNCVIRWFIYVISIIAFIVFIPTVASSEFIYFKF